MTSTTPTVRLIMASAVVSFALTALAMLTFSNHAAASSPAGASLRSVTTGQQTHAVLLAAKKTTKAKKKTPSVSIQAANAVFKAINAQRKAHHLPALKWKVGLQKSSINHDKAMTHKNQFSHQVPGEAFFANRISAQHVNWVAAGENIGWTSNLSVKGALQIHGLMMAEKAPNDGHRKNILSKTYNSVGIAVVIDRSRHKLYITEDFTRS